MTTRRKMDSPATPPLHFSAVMLEYPLHENSLMIPRKSASLFGRDLSENVTLKVPDGRSWKVELKKCGDKIALDNGLSKFLEHYSVQYFYTLIFSYHGDSTFHVFICDALGSEIDYAGFLCNREYHVKKRRREEEEEEEEEDDDDDDDDDHVTRRAEPKIRRRNLASPVKRGKYYSTHGRLAMPEEVKKAVREASLLRLKNPSFMVLMTPYILSQNVVCVPVEFVRKHFSFDFEYIELEARGARKRWSVRCYREGATSEKKRMGRGWGPFSEKQKLKEGDVCVFELVNKDKRNALLKVWIFRAADYAN